ncbi:hypothetical protein BCR37DRAFT_393814 [Protomyces lactucae-debilis]|uniref:GIT Spa2 homology (SHD) domain-containing protein n=1 Tax=Protomyces lactucae-debilis TaxID=2754530 RepID=A0A1Y2FC69_PROLT|nr:uncharacterized protein BCR37DRAFT_393814 [Protomyces lactucae-debilis]ORY80455.1 hypothetical protein BCR37DRAFT_393814 [Protomyces lactucae-debilis]
MSGSRFAPGEHAGPSQYRQHPPGQPSSNNSSTYQNPASPTGFRQASSGNVYGARQQPFYPQGSGDTYTSGGGGHAYQRSVSEQSNHTYHSASGSMAGSTAALDRQWTPAPRIPASQSSLAGVPGEDAITQAERAAQRHWQVLGQFLGKDREPVPPRMVVKAREKLTRLSATQFQELSTDVYDEVLRRQFAAQGGPGPPALEPDAAYHPKRNQARERLSALTMTRFRDLAADVYHEIGRRFPDVARQSTDTSQDARSRGSAGSQLPTSPIAEKPKPNLRNTTFIPVKSAMVEDDDGDEDLMEQVQAPIRSRGTEFDTASAQSSEYGKSSPIARSQTNGDAPARQADRSSELRIKELEDKLAVLEVTAREASARAAGRGDLESALQEALERNDKLESQVQQLQKQVKQAAPQEELDRVKKSLTDQQSVETEMRQALDNLMIDLRQMSDRESSMQAQLEKLAQDLLEQKQQTSAWQAQAQKSKLALRQVKVTSAFFAPGGGLSADGTTNGIVAAAAGLISTSGAIQDLSFAQFQGGIDELLRVARMQPQLVLEPMRTLVTATKAIQLDIRQSGIEQSEEKVAKLMLRLSSTANNLMIACRNHVGSAGLSPVSLVDAAASHLTSTVIELAKICKIRSIPQQAEVEPELQLPRVATAVAQKDVDDDLPFTPHGQAEMPHKISFQVTEPPPASPDRAPPAPPSAATKRDSLQDLKVSLETQTEAIVTSIQKLLAAIRADQKPAVLQQFIGDIVVSVTTATSLLQPAYLSSEESRSLRQELQGIRVALESCCSRLRNMENGAAEQPAHGASKEYKQRLAGVAFDTAKQTKELSMALERVDAEDLTHDVPDLT